MRKKAPLFTPEELEELRRADAEMDRMPCENAEYLARSKRTMAELGAEIRNIRKALGWSQQELAEKIGLCRTNVYKWERGERPPRLDLLADAAPEFERLIEKEKPSPAATTPETADKKDKHNKVHLFKV